MTDEFYIGYQDRCPPGLARHIRGVVALLAVLAVTLGAGIASRQLVAEPGEFEFGIRQPFEGVLSETPLPTLRSVAADGRIVRYLLVGAGKHGLPPFARGHSGERVRFNGSLIRKGEAVMIEMNDPASFTVLDPARRHEPATGEAAPRDGEWTGELVDTKCYLGVMRPATGKVHRACAVRCLSGGIPPALLLRDDTGAGVAVPMTGPDQRPLPFDVQWAARRVRARGTLVWEDGFPRLEVIELSLAADDDERP